MICNGCANGPKLSSRCTSTPHGASPSIVRLVAPGCATSAESASRCLGTSPSDSTTMRFTRPSCTKWRTPSRAPARATGRSGDRSPATSAMSAARPMTGRSPTSAHAGVGHARAVTSLCGFVDRAARSRAVAARAASVARQSSRGVTWQSSLRDRLALSRKSFRDADFFPKRHVVAEVCADALDRARVQSGVAPRTVL